MKAFAVRNGFELTIEKEVEVKPKRKSRITKVSIFNPQI